MVQSGPARSPLPGGAAPRRADGPALTCTENAGSYRVQGAVPFFRDLTNFQPCFRF